MHLLDYLQEKGLTREAFGQQLNPPVSVGKVNHWLKGGRRVSLREALQVHVLCEGRVSLQELADMYRGGDDEERGSIPQVSGTAAVVVHPNAVRAFV